MTFDELLQAARGSEELIMPGSWSQGRATFGGLTAALMFENGDACCRGPRHAVIAGLVRGTGGARSAGQVRGRDSA